MAGYVELFKVGKSFPSARGPVSVVRDFSLNIAQGELVALIGHSGCGKSTVLSMVAGLTSCSEGAIVVARREIQGAGPDRGVVFQAPCLLPWLTALQNVQLGVDQVFFREPAARRSERAAHYLERVGLGDALHKRPQELSQGMQQRVGIARAFALNPKMLLLDEPFGMLDSLTRLELQDVLVELLTEHRITAMMVTHDVDEALFLADRVVMMTNGPDARVGEVVEVGFERPRRRADVLASPEYYRLRTRLLDFLEEQERLKHPAAVEEATEDDSTALATPALVG